MLRTFILLLLLSLSFNSVLLSQSRGINRDKYQIHINKIQEEISIDGNLNEAVWENAEMVTRFHRVLPTDTGYAQSQTEVKVCYNETHLFLAIVCLDLVSGKRPVESLRRDWSFPKNDNFIVFIDTYNDQTNGFAFGISPAGAQWDGIQSNGGKVNLDWDTKWRSATQNYEDKWTAEFAIPFRSLRYKGGAKEWGINFSRQDLKTGEKSSWAPMPRQFATATLAFTGSLIWDNPLPGSGPRFSVIPYISSQASQNTSIEDKIGTSLHAGVDAKVILSTSMNLDLTFLPDFSQVEVDRQQINLDRYELFFPEKRQFFLENSDLFANLGSDGLRPFFSRRIGLTNPVLGGARLSGKIGEKWRIGFMDMQSRGNTSIYTTNYAVASVQRQVFKRSFVSGFIVNRQRIQKPFDQLDLSKNFNRVAGVEFNLASADNKWTGKSYYHRSFDQGKSGKNGVFANTLTYATQFISASINQALVGADYQADVGYIRRQGYFRINPEFQYKFFPENSSIANHGPGIESDLYFDNQANFTDRDLQLHYQITWLNKSAIKLDVRNTFWKLLFDFDPTHTNGIPFDKGDQFTWNEAGLSYASDIRKPFNYTIETRYGGYFTGRKLSINNELFYRLQPFSSLAIVSSFNRIDLPEPHSSADFILFGPRLDITFTKNIFFTGLVQYNNQIDNLNFNLRFQWRFAPVSDLYIIYTENSHPLNYNVKDRGLAIKLSYWFN